MARDNAYKYKGKIYRPSYIDSIGKNLNELDSYDSEEFNKLLALESKKNGLDIALNINSLSRKLKIAKLEVDKYLLWLYKKGSIVLFSNGHRNSFYDKDKNTDKNIENIYLIRLKKDFIDKINKSLKIIDKKEKYRIIYNDKKRYLYINNLYITKFTFDKTNDRLMSFLIKNPNTKFTKIELQKRIAKINRLQSFRVGDLQTKIIQIGFKGDTLKAFFDVSSTSIIFHNPVYESRLKDLKIEHLSITQTT